MLHSDQGVTYTSKLLSNTVTTMVLHEHEQTGYPYDNAPMNYIISTH